MGKPLDFQEFVFKATLTTEKRNRITLSNTKGTPSAKPDAALADLLEVCLILYGVRWMDEQYAKAKRAERKRKKSARAASRTEVGG